MKKANRLQVKMRQREMSEDWFGDGWRSKGDYTVKLYYMGVSINGGSPKSSILIVFSFINHPFWGTTIVGTPHIEPSDSNRC